MLPNADAALEGLMKEKAELSLAGSGDDGDIGDVGDAGAEDGDSGCFDAEPRTSPNPLKPKVSEALGAEVGASPVDSVAGLGWLKAVEPKAEDVGFEAEAAALALVNAEAFQPDPPDGDADLVPNGETATGALKVEEVVA